MQTLPQIISHNQELKQTIERDINEALEIEDPIQMEKELERIAAVELEGNDAFSNKVNGWVWVIRGLIASATFFRKEAAALAKHAQRLEKAADKMSDYLLEAMKTTGNREIQTKHYRLKIQKATNRRLDVNNDWQGDIPDEYLKAQDIEDLIDTTAVKKALREGKHIPFAKLAEPTEYIGGLKNN